jgi:hypothetical protein
VEKLQFLGAAIAFFAVGALMVFYENIRIKAGRPILNGLRQLSDDVCSWSHRRGHRNCQMTATAWGQIGWFFAVAAIGVAIWYFKVHRKRPPH